ncbi:hypothetical protein BpHYR1_031254 [Brachionus plicatilis]|uniref:Uncharacterized protein n=1 Tax=Brachionus plicatilis TaxID=10195 RepID=A0A3M7RZT0_BRAPC|nr:hypothetical protein BpHYR1_031254 [Brachionus plicatilis]
MERSIKKGNLKKRGSEETNWDGFGIRLKKIGFTDLDPKVVLGGGREKTGPKRTTTYYKILSSLNNDSFSYRNITYSTFQVKFYSYDPTLDSQKSLIKKFPLGVDSYSDHYLPVENLHSHLY